MSHELMGTAEVAEFLGISRGRVTQLAQSEDFPTPIARLAAGPVWEFSDIDAWAREHGRIE